MKQTMYGHVNSRKLEMRIWVATKNCTAIRAHRLNSRGYRTYWQEYRVTKVRNAEFSNYGAVNMPLQAGSVDQFGAYSGAYVASYNENPVLSLCGLGSFTHDKQRGHLLDRLLADSRRQNLFKFVAMPSI